jgi:glycerophosphoryl diester phosphodiesterase
VIAHRGASGYLPEHTREAKVLAYGQGADYVEQDVVSTADEQLVVLHDVCLDDVTDVARRFPGRRRADGRFYVVDFTLDELKVLRVVERRREGTDERVFPGRFHDDGLEFRIVTFDEELRLVRALNAKTGRAVGVYPEIKAPAFHHEHGIDLAARVLDALRLHGYSRHEDLAVVQCFDSNELQRSRYELGSELKLAQLTEASSPSLPADLAAMAEYADIWAPHYSALVERPEGREELGEGLAVSEAALTAGRAGLELHPYTFRLDAVPAEFVSLEQQLEFFFRRVGVGAVFCDHPDVAVGVRNRQRQRAHIE